jgi:hypothetical protein
MKQIYYEYIFYGESTNVNLVIGTEGVLASKGPQPLTSITEVVCFSERNLFFAFLV